MIQVPTITPSPFYCITWSYSRTQRLTPPPLSPPFLPTFRSGAASGCTCTLSNVISRSTYLALFTSRPVLEAQDIFGVVCHNSSANQRRVLFRSTSRTFPAAERVLHGVGSAKEI